MIKEAFSRELNNAKVLMKKKEYDTSFFHLERAHILGQSFVVQHSISHLYMLKIYLLKREYINSLGQLVRLLLGILGSLVGIIPIGNTGGSNISMFQRMEIPDDIREFMK